MKKASKSHKSLLIRRVAVKDARQFYDLKLKSIQTDPEVFLATMEEMENKTMPEILAWIKHDYIFGAFVRKKLIGTIHLIEQKPEKFKHIGIVGGLYVNPDYRGQGIGRKLTEKLLSYAKKKFYSLQLKVVPTDIAAIKLYESFGFFCWAKEKNALYHKGKYGHQLHYMLVL